MALSLNSSVLRLVALQICLLGTLADSVALADSPPPAKPQGVSQLSTPAKKARGDGEAASRSGAANAPKSPLVSPQETPRTSLGRLNSPTLSTAVFIENMGQFDSRVRYQVKIGGQTAWLTIGGIVFDATRPPERERGASKAKPGDLPDLLGALAASAALDRPKSPTEKLDRLVFIEDFVGAACCSKIAANGPQSGVYNYFEGSDPNKWVTNARGYAEVVYHEVWPGIDLRIYGNGPDLEQEFVAKPGADLKRINISYRGINKLSLSRDGSLLVDTLFGQLHETKPVIYQQIAGAKVVVDGSFKLTSDTGFTFDVGTYRTDYALVIDPTLLYSTFLGGSSYNTINSMDVDASGNAYVVGSTSSSDFPTTTGALQSGTHGGGFVTKLNASGSALVYSTLLGSNYFIFGIGSTVTGVAVDSQGNTYVTGYGSNIPSTPNAYSACSGRDGFLTVLGPAGNQLVYSTCLHSPVPVGIAIDSAGRAFIAGSGGCGLPTTPNAFQPTCPSGSSGYLMVLDTTLSGAASLVYSSYLGDPSQSLNTFVGGIALDSFGKAYITGQVYSNTNNTGQFPTTPGAFKTTLAPCTPRPSGENESFCQWPYVAKFDTTAQGPNSLIYSTYIGYASQSTMTGDGIPFQMPLSMGIAVDGSGNAYITGGAGSTYPTTPGAYKTTGSGTFVTKLNASGSNLIYSTFLPTTSFPAGSGVYLYFTPFTNPINPIGFPIAVDSQGRAYISGNTTAANYPVTPDAVQSKLADNILGGGGDAFLTVLNSAGSGLVYSSYLGGGKAENGIAVVLDQTGDVYVAGQTTSIDFPVTASAYQASIKGTSSNLFISKFPLSTSQALSVSSATPAAGGTSGPVTLQIFGAGFHAGATAQLNCPSPILGTNIQPRINKGT